MHDGTPRSRAIQARPVNAKALGVGGKDEALHNNPRFWELIESARTASKG